jgi:prepilin-type N-terminal cleavage/methylation domain-containing protein
MKTHSSLCERGFTLLETVIAMGVLAVLLTGFLIVFAPAAAGIKKSINVQEADRLVATLEQELVTLRAGQGSTDITAGFSKAFDWIKKSNTADDALLVYQYRGSLSGQRNDGTPEPLQTVIDKLPGKDYAVQTMMRRKSDAKFKEDLTAVEGGVYFVKCAQLVFTGGELKAAPAGVIFDPKNTGTPVASADAYPEAVIAFTAEFYTLPTKSASYFDASTGFAKAFTAAKIPVFTRNLAVRR